MTELIADLGQLIRQELRLVQAEASEKLKQAQNGVYAIITGLLVAFCALLILLQALVVGLSNVMPAWLASLSVGLVLAIVAFVLIGHGRNNLKAKNLVPERSLRAGRDLAVREDAQRNVQIR
ncbi:MAG: phage holin family protein [Kiloniellaceae bacterium]